MSTRPMQMRDLLASQSVAAALTGDSKSAVLKNLADVAAKATGQDAHTIFDVLWEREKLGTTGIGLGIAIPHGRVEGLDHVHGFFARLAQPIDFNSIDEKPVDLVFLLLAPESAGADHLHALAIVSRLLRDPKLCEQLRRGKTENDLYRLLSDAATAEVAA